MAAEKNIVKDVYVNVINDVINGVRESFTDDGVDEMVLQELKQVWESKLSLCKAVEKETSTATTVLLTSNSPLQETKPTITAAENQHSLPNQPQFMRMPQAHHLLPGVTRSNIPHLSMSAQVAASSLPPAYIHQLINFTSTQGPNQYVYQPVPIAVGSSSNQQIAQLDGLGDSSSDEEDENDHEDDDDDDDDQNEEAEDADVVEEDPLNSDDDVSESDPAEVFDAENVVVCQFDKINRCKNRWKFHLKDGIMNLNGHDYLFQRATGDAEW